MTVKVDPLTLYRIKFLLFYKKWYYINKEEGYVAFNRYGLLWEEGLSRWDRLSLFYPIVQNLQQITDLNP